MASCFPAVDGFQRVFYLPENSRILHMRSIGLSQLSQLTNPGAVGKHLARYGFNSAPFLFYSFVMRIPKILRSQYKCEYADVSTDKQLQLGFEILKFFQINTGADRSSAIEVVKIGSVSFSNFRDLFKRITSVFLRNLVPKKYLQ